MKEMNERTQKTTMPRHQIAYMGTVNIFVLFCKRKRNYSTRVAKKKKTKVFYNR